MPSWRNKPPNKKDFLKRRSFAQGKAELDAAHIAAQRLYGEVLEFWRHCKHRSCRRHRRCCGGDPGKCVGYGAMFTPLSRRLRARNDVMAGGPRHIPPARHIEWFVRRLDPREILYWKIG